VLTPFLCTLWLVSGDGWVCCSRRRTQKKERGKMEDHTTLPPPCTHTRTHARTYTRTHAHIHAHTRSVHRRTDAHMRRTDPDPDPGKDADADADADIDTDTDDRHTDKQTVSRTQTHNTPPTSSHISSLFPLIHEYVCVCVCKPACVCVCAFLLPHNATHTHTHIHMHTRTHVRTHAHAYDWYQSDL